ncbi:MAG: putative immunity protein [Bacteroidia bacterium]
MRDKRFVAEHRGGPLKKAQHYQLMHWARKCAEHVLTLLEDKIDSRLINALQVAKDWENGKATVGDARKASVNAHAFARETTNPVETAVARATGHTVATAHMADHSLGGALYALKALKLGGKSIEAERNWQNEQLPEEIRELVLSSRAVKEKSFKLES